MKKTSDLCLGRDRAAGSPTPGSNAQTAHLFIRRGLDCPKFKTINVTAGYEVRSYKRAKYAGVLLSRNVSYARAYVKGLTVRGSWGSCREFAGLNAIGMDL